MLDVLESLTLWLGMPNKLHARIDPEQFSKGVGWGGVWGVIVFAGVYVVFFWGGVFLSKFPRMHYHDYKTLKA